MFQYVNGVDEDGVLQIDVIIWGEVFDLLQGVEFILILYYENYIQIG